MKILDEFALPLVSGGLDNVVCPVPEDDAPARCPTVEITGPSNYGTASPSFSDNVWGAVGGTAVGGAITIVADGFIAGAGIAAGIASAPLLVPIVIGGIGAVAAAAFAQAIANSANGGVTVAIGRTSSGQVSTVEP